jgi:hypothetical protein
MEGLRCPGVGTLLAHVPGYQAAGVLGLVCGARDTHLYPSSGEVALKSPGCVYVLERQSRITPRPAAIGSTAVRGARRTDASGSSIPRFTLMERRYGGILSVGRRAPCKAEMTTSQRLARRRVAEFIEARSRASYRTPV